MQLIANRTILIGGIAVAKGETFHIDEPQDKDFLARKIARRPNDPDPDAMPPKAAPVPKAPPKESPPKVAAKT